MIDRVTRARAPVRVCMFGIAAMLAFGSAAAQETISYTYDARGRLVIVDHGASGPNAGVSSSYTYDKADNRTKLVVSADGGTTTITLSPSNLPNGAVGTAYSQTITASGGTGGYIFTTTAGNLPDGLNLSSGGMLSGTPTTAATSSFTITATDGSANAGSQTYSVTVASAGQPCTGVNFTIASNGAVTEGTNSIFTVTKHGTATGSCAIGYATANGTATAGSDYTAQSGSLTFTTNQASGAVSVPTIVDGIAEGNQTFSMSLSNPTGGATVGSPNSSTATISDGPCSGISFTVQSNGAVTEGASSSFTVTKSGSTSASCSVNYSTANGTAVAPGDYTAKSGTLTFTPTQTGKTFSVTTIDDSSVESAQTFKLNLSNPADGATLGAPNSATATINDNDSAPSCGNVSYTISDAANTEGAPLSFSVTKSGSTSSSCSVNYATADGTAIAGTHYVADSGTLTFSAAQTSKAVSVPTIDTARKVTKTMFVNLSGANGGAAIADAQGTGSISGSNVGGGGCDLCLMSNNPPDSSTAEEAPTDQPSTMNSTPAPSPAPDDTPTIDPTTSDTPPDVPQ